MRDIWRTSGDAVWMTAFCRRRRLLLFHYIHCKQQCGSRVADETRACKKPLREVCLYRNRFRPNNENTKSARLGAERLTPTR